MVHGTLDIAEKFWTRDEAFRYCEHLTRSHYENFPVASMLLPSETRKHVSTIYAFARTADDFADEPGLTPTERLDALRDWEEQLVQCYHGLAQHPVFIALQQTVERFAIPMQLFRDLLHAFRSDVTTNRYETFQDVLEYCRHSANPVGRLVLILFDSYNESRAEYSDSICTGLQLANFWQDLSVDLDRNRVYLPQEDLRRFGYTEDALFSRTFNDAFRSLLAFQVERTEKLFRGGRPLLESVGSSLSRELKLTWWGGMTILQKVRDLNYNTLTRRPVLTWRDGARLVLKSFFG